MYQHTAKRFPCSSYRDGHAHIFYGVSYRPASRTIGFMMHKDLGGESVFVSQAMGIIRNLRWYHLGFCFFWAITFTALSGSSDEYGQAYGAYSILRQLITLISLGVIAVLGRRRKTFSPCSAVYAGAILAVGSLLYYLSFCFGLYSSVVVFVSSIFVGSAVGAFYVMWQAFFASEGSSRTTVYIPFSAAISVVLCVVLSILPVEVMIFCAIVILPTCATYTLYASLRDVEPYEVLPMTSGRFRLLVRDMWKPVFCVCAIGFVWRLVSYLAGAMSEGLFITIMAGMSVATLAVSVIDLFSAKGFDILYVYQVLFPIITGAFLLPTFFGDSWLLLASGCTMFGFEVVNLLLLITCAVYANRFAMDSTFVYAICIGPVLFSLLLGDVVSKLLTYSALYDLTFVVDVLFVCIYVLVAALFVISVPIGKKRVFDSTKSDESAADSSSLLRDRVKQQEPLSSASSVQVLSSAEPGTLNASSASSARDATVALDESDFRHAFQSTLETRIAALGLVDKLTPREIEVAGLILQGNTVSAIARKLFISENTVRGHTKSIYRKMDVHSKQELIDKLS